MYAVLEPLFKPAWEKALLILEIAWTRLIFPLAIAIKYDFQE
jgi:hypothetical protein